jgi:hypothetical protein
MLAAAVRGGQRRDAHRKYSVTEGSGNFEKLRVSSKAQCTHIEQGAVYAYRARRSVRISSKAQCTGREAKALAPWPPPSSPTPQSAWQTMAVAPCVTACQLNPCPGCLANDDSRRWQATYIDLYRTISTEVGRDFAVLSFGPTIAAYRRRPTSRLRAAPRHLAGSRGEF